MNQYQHLPTIVFLIRHNQLNQWGWGWHFIYKHGTRFRKRVVYSDLRHGKRFSRFQQKHLKDISQLPWKYATWAPTGGHLWPWLLNMEKEHSGRCWESQVSTTAPHRGRVQRAEGNSIPNNQQPSCQATTCDNVRTKTDSTNTLQSAQNHRPGVEAVRLNSKDLAKRCTLRY